MTLRFGTDGVRGVALVDLTVELVTALGRAAAAVLSPVADGVVPAFVIGRDTRESGPALEAALAAGLIAGGATVELVGVLPTPGVAFECAERNAPGAVISASHNPFPDNGIKFFSRGGRKLSDQEEVAIEAELTRVLARDADGGDAPVASAPMDTVGAGAQTRYVEHIVAVIEGHAGASTPLRGQRVVIDCGNGAASRVGALALRALGADVVVLHADPDGRNINAGCGSTDPSELQARVVAESAVAGLAFDGDADRVIAVDAEGRLVDGDQILAMTAIDLYERGRLRGNAIAATVMSNLGLHRALDARSISIIETPVGDRAVLEAIASHDLALGGEQSGHVIFADHATTGDGVLTGAFILALMARTGSSLAVLAGVMERVPQLLVNVRVGDRAGLDAAASFWSAVSSVETELGRDGRILVRPSGTEPVVRIMVEAPTHAATRRIAKRLETALVSALGAP
jgi:phosphoglucosamine mutase